MAGSTHASPTADAAGVAAHLAHLSVEETVYEPMAAAYGCLRSQERARGVALLDMGLHSTDLVIYDGEAFVFSNS